MTMMAHPPELPTQSNKHFLNGVVELSRIQDVEVSEDIFAQNGMKLVARGTKISPEFYDRIVSHKLAKPIETALCARDALSGDDYSQEAGRLLDEVPLLSSICHWSKGRVTPLGMFSQMRFNGASNTLLAVSQQRAAGQVRHDVLVSMLAMGLANAHRFNDSELLSGVGVAGLLHDIGESYVDPTFMNAGRPLTPREWMSYGGHPIIGAALSREIAGMGPLVQRAILEHHERLDGFGYPRSLNGNAFSAAGRILSLAETLSALVCKPAACRRIDIAMKIMPGEYEPEMVSLLSDLLNDQDASFSADVVAADAIHDSIHKVFMRIVNVLTMHDEVVAMPGALSARGKAMLNEIVDRFARVQRAFDSTGVARLAEMGGELSHLEMMEVQFEASCVLDEIAWRLMKLSRELALKSMALPEAEQRALMPLVDALAGAAREPIACGVVA